MEDKRAKVAERHRYKHPLRPLQQGDIVRMQPIQTGERTWKQATVTKTLPHRSYEVITDTGGQYRRNRQFLRVSAKSRSDAEDTACKTPASPKPLDTAARPPSPASSPGITSQSNNAGIDTGHEPMGLTMPSAMSPVRTRSGRIIKQVDRLNL